MQMLCYINFRQLILYEMNPAPKIYQKSLSLPPLGCGFAHGKTLYRCSTPEILYSSHTYNYFIFFLVWLNQFNIHLAPVCRPRDTSVMSGMQTGDGVLTPGEDNCKGCENLLDKTLLEFLDVTGNNARVWQRLVIALWREVGFHNCLRESGLRNVCIIGGKKWVTFWAQFVKS